MDLLVFYYDLIKTVKDDLKEQIVSKNALIYHDELPIILGDKTQLRQVFQNLISNAIKFTDNDKPLIRITNELVDKYWIIKIEDNGIGIPEKDLINIFGIFKKLHRQNEYEGQGIGLSICKRIIERHEGEIWVESEVNKGTTFYFSLPHIVF